MSKPVKQTEAGWALLTILLFSALLVIAVSSWLPRAAVETRRDKEEMLIHRGKQYERAIQLYFRKNRRYPAKIEDLENSNGVRFLRKRFIDPMTGSEEWRLVNVGPNGVLTNSKVNPPGSAGASMMGFPMGGVPQQQTSAGTVQLSPMGQPIGQPMGQMGPQIGGIGAPTAPTGLQGSAPAQPMQPQLPPGLQGLSAQQLAQMGIVLPQQPQVPGQVPGQPVPGQPMAQPGMPQPGQPGYISGVVMGSTGATMGAYGVLPGSVGVTVPGYVPIPGAPAPGIPAGAQGAIPGAAPGAVLGAPGGMSPAISAGGLTPGVGTAGPGGQVFGGGIAGVASTRDGSGFKVWNGRENYSEWEFIYDFRKDPLMLGAMAAGAMQQQQQGTPNVPGQPPVTPGPFGNPSGSGTPGQGGFGTQPIRPPFGQPGGVGLTQPGVGGLPPPPPRR